MDIKLIIIIAFSYLYGFFELFMGIRQRFKREKKIVKYGDRASIWILIILIGIGYFLAFRVGITRLGRIYHWNIFFYNRSNIDNSWADIADQINFDASAALYIYSYQNRES